MPRQIATYTLAHGQNKELKTKMLNWANRFSILLLLDSNQYPDAYGRYECLLAVGNTCAKNIQTLTEVQQYHDAHQDWLFGHITYDYKNELEPKLSSVRTSRHHFAQLQFFCPETVVHISRDGLSLTIETLEPHADDVFSAIIDCSPFVGATIPKLTFQQRIAKDTYLDTISKLRKHIADGDCYEINYCAEGYAQNVTLEPLQVFNALNTISPAPFAAFYRNADNYMMCASPERYLYKQGGKILSQPIKGTARRDADKVKDEAIKQALQESTKDRAENVMIVDLVRNDIARSANVGSVQVEELFGIYTFPQVHQMISTVSGQLKENAPFTDVIRYSFPMGSMTGAPKVKVMQLVEQYELSRRELFAGTVGYITPGGDFDFNVIIRSLFYNAATQYLSYQTGGAITYDSTPEQEWEEMRLKAWALERIFS